MDGDATKGDCSMGERHAAAAGAARTAAGHGEALRQGRAQPLVALSSLRLSLSRPLLSPLPHPHQPIDLLSFSPLP